MQLPRWARAGLYVGMGWIAVLAIGPLADALPGPAMALLITVYERRFFRSDG